MLTMLLLTVIVKGSFLPADYQSGIPIMITPHLLIITELIQQNLRTQLKIHYYTKYCRSAHFQTLMKHQNVRQI